MDDLISRQAAIDDFYKYPNVKWTTLDVLEHIDALPSAERRGRWIYKEAYKDAHFGYFVCSLCGEAYWKPSANYCPNCGARMEGDE